jgi:hypothetical protein
MNLAQLHSIIRSGNSQAWKLVRGPQYYDVADVLGSPVFEAVYEGDLSLRIEWDHPARQPYADPTSVYKLDGFTVVVCLLIVAGNLSSWHLINRSDRGDVYLPVPTFYGNPFTDLLSPESLALEVSEIDYHVAQLVDELSENLDFEDYFREHQLVIAQPRSHFQQGFTPRTRID